MPGPAPGSDHTDTLEGPCLRASGSGRQIYKHKTARQARAESTEGYKNNRATLVGKGSGTRLIPKGPVGVVLLEEEEQAKWEDQVRACGFLAQVPTAYGDGET